MAKEADERSMADLLKSALKKVKKFTPAQHIDLLVQAKLMSPAEAEKAKQALAERAAPAP